MSKRVMTYTLSLFVILFFSMGCLEKKEKSVSKKTTANLPDDSSNESSDNSNIFEQKVSVSGLFTCFITQGGVTKCWGDNTKGQLGNSTTVNSLTPVNVSGDHSFQFISTNDKFTCAINTSNKLYCWGDNANGQIGDGTIIDKTSPVEVDNSTEYIQVSLGSSGFTCGLTDSGNVKCWGLNTDGQLGNGTNNSSNSPVMVSGSDIFTQITVGHDHACGLLESGLVKCWGNNTSGKLGDGSTNDSNTPVFESTSSTFQYISAGYAHTCGITQTGGIKCWGNNLQGQLGDGTGSSSSTAVDVDSNEIFESVNLGYTASCAITSAGLAKCWGNNGIGNLGDGTNFNSYGPVNVTGNIAFEALSQGSYGSTVCGVSTDGKFYCWGSNAYGNFGDGTSTNQSTPRLITIN